MAPIVGVSKSNYFASSFMALLLFPMVVMADATNNGTPGVGLNIQTPNTWCGNENEMAFAPNQKPIKCIGNNWRYLGISGLWRNHTGSGISPAEIGQFKTMTSSCPAGKRVVSGGCALLAGYGRSQSLVMSMASADLSYWQCTFGPLTPEALENFQDPFGTINAPSMSIEVYCADY